MHTICYVLMSVKKQRDKGADIEERDKHTVGLAFNIFSSIIAI